MPAGWISKSDLLELNFYPGAGGQWYRNFSGGNGDSSDNHTHLIGAMKQPGYDPSKNTKPAEVLQVDKIEFKMRFDGRGIQRVWLVQTPEGDFLLPHLASTLNVEEATLARRLFDALPPSLNAQ